MVFLQKNTLPELALRAAQKYRKKTAFQIFRDGGVYDQVSYAQFGRRVRQFAGLFRRLGIRAGDRVMLLAENRPEWGIACFGAALAEGVIVPALIGFTGEQIKAIAEHSGAALICCTERTAEKAAFAAAEKALPLVRLDGLEEDSILASVAGQETALSLPHIEIPDEDLWDRDEKFPEEKLCSVTEDDLASIIYTSGTTGASKGVMLSHGNLIFIARSSRSLMKIFSRDRLLSVIPLAHTYECTLGLLTPLLSGASVTYLDRPPSPAVLLPAMQTLRPTAMVSVPLFIEKIYRNQIAPGLEANPLYHCPLTRLLAVKLAGGRLLASLGGALRFFGVGGAPLAPDVEDFLRKAGFPYSPGYGLTEAAPLVAGTAPYRFAQGSAGRPLRGVELRFVKPEGETIPPDEDMCAGEIQVRGPNVMMGYYRDREKTKESFTPEGWLKTGDLGFLDKKGHLYIRGRVKALILGPSGENIYPEEIEGILHTSLLVEDALVVPGKKGELVALIVLSERAQTAAAALGDSLEELKNMVNRRVAAFSRLARIEVRETPFEKTATLKIKRFLYTGR